MFDLFCPVQIRNVGQAVNAVLNLNEHAEIGDALDLARNMAADRMIHPHQLPRIGRNLLEPQGDTPVVGVNVQHNDIDLIPDRQQLGGMGDALGPRHFGHVQQALDTALQLDKGAVIGQADDFSVHATLDRITLGNGEPGIGNQLLETQRDPLALGIVLEDHDLDGLAGLDHFRRVADTAPRHIGHVQQAVDATEIDKRPVVGDILDRSLQNDPLLKQLQRLFAQGRPFLLQNRSARDHHIGP